METLALIVACIGLVAVVAVAYGVGVALCMLAWNAVMPALGLATLSFWQMAALLFVVSMIGGCLRSHVTVEK